MPRFSPLERQILQALTSHISQNEEVSLTALAEECHVSKSSVVKAVQKLGYRGFSDLSYHVRFNAQTSSGSLLPEPSPRRPSTALPPPSRNASTAAWASATSSLRATGGAGPSSRRT